jgi:hypothetical protein
MFIETEEIQFRVMLEDAKLLYCTIEESRLSWQSPLLSSVLSPNKHILTRTCHCVSTLSVPSRVRPRAIDYNDEKETDLLFVVKQMVAC